MRKSIELIGKLCERHEISTWRQYQYNINRIKRLYRYAQSSKHGGTRTEEQKQKSEQNIIDKHQGYIDLSEGYIEKINQTIEEIVKTKTLSTIDQAIMVSIDDYVKHAFRQIDQIRRRVIQKESIPHNEKVFSLFEPHTEWICKNKLGIPVELGLKVCIVEDEHQFILHHNIIRKQSDDKVAVSIAQETKLRYPNLCSISYDRGFFTKKNREALGAMLNVALPKKGKLSKQDQDIESSDEYITAKKKHSAVESAINALDMHGLDKCPDHGLVGFSRYVALAIVARNLQRLGAIIHKKDHRLLVLRERRLKKAA
jgi:glycine cleavage system H lipoate-binding protein